MARRRQDGGTRRKSPLLEVRAEAVTHKPLANFTGRQVLAVYKKGSALSDDILICLACVPL